jgi:hypothetical protein
MASTLPDDWQLLPEQDRLALNPDLKLLWASIPASHRPAVLAKAHRRAATSRARLERRRARSEACAEYIDALCALGETPVGERDAARARLQAARVRYREIRRTV